MSTYYAKPGDVTPSWHLIDAENQIVGRLAVEIARVLVGKHRPEYTPHCDVGDFVVVVNCEKVRFSGSKMETKEYQRFTGYPGGRKVSTFREVIAKKPEMVLWEAVRRMLPKNNLARAQLTKLKLYAGTDHPHQAQQPKPLKFASLAK